MFAVVLMNRGQPALLFLGACQIARVVHSPFFAYLLFLFFLLVLIVPGTLLPTLFFAYTSGHLHLMWVGPPSVYIHENDSSHSDHEESVSEVDGAGKRDEQMGLLRDASV